MAENITTYVHRSNFAPYIIEYLAERHALGYNCRASAYILRAFDKFCCEYYPNRKTIDLELVSGWIAHQGTLSPKTTESKCTILNGLVKYMLRTGVDNCVLTTGLVPKISQSFLPHIYTKEELKELFRIIDTKKYKQHMHKYILPVAFRLSYCCGLRPGEIATIRREDVDFNARTIRILESKGSSRIVVMSEDLNALCSKMDTILEALVAGREYLIQYNAQRYRRQNLTYTFGRVLEKFSANNNQSNIRLYDLRHTFATHKIYEWTLDGKDVNELLPYLSEYMGHTCIGSTLYYLHLASEIYPEIKRLSPQWLVKRCEAKP